MENNVLIELLSTIGISGIFIWLYIEAQKSVKDKDSRIREMTDNILDVVRENTEVQTELKASIKENTQASRTLTERVGQVLSNNRKE